MTKLLLKTFGISKLLPKTSKPASAPGTVTYIGKKQELPVKLHMIDYNETDFTEKNLESLVECLPFKDNHTVTWLNYTGVHDIQNINEVGEIFQIHPLVLSDIANTTQRPKVEEYDNYIFTVIKMCYFKENTGEVYMEQVSLLIGKDYVISFQENDIDVLEGLRERIRNGKGCRVRRLGSDYLLYCIIDAIVDNYFSVLENIGGQIELLEKELMLNATQELLAKIYGLKQELVYLRKSIWPMREVVSTIQRSEHDLVNEGTYVYMRDVYDHTIQVVETVETFRDMASGMLDLYLSTMSNKMNEIMKVLTLFAAIFIPLTFLAGIYGMNFEFMPELKWRFSYPVWWFITISLVVGMIIYFKRKKWL
ncbi:MAG: magnesium/cobalt transporter CorA [Proteobacteria bacterium]|nr:magnesium/cobalt transporter CorA [Pseudomonadota bacterium]MBU4035849.1 magnesium/cobalt transporter CorA [Pseudomonadota bacterium]